MASQGARLTKRIRVDERARLTAERQAVRNFGHETGIKQDAEVLGNGWAAHLDMSRNRVFTPNAGSFDAARLGDGTGEPDPSQTGGGMKRSPDDERASVDQTVTQRGIPDDRFNVGVGLRCRAVRSPTKLPTQALRHPRHPFM